MTQSRPGGPAVAAAMFYALFAIGPALAQQVNRPSAGAPPQGAKMDENSQEAVDQGETAYSAAFEQLTPEQKAKLKEFEKPFLNLTVGTQTRLHHMSLMLRHCAGVEGTAVNRDPAKYQAAFKAHIAAVAAKEDPLKAQLLERRRAETPFIDQFLVDQHYRYIVRLKLGINVGANESLFKQGEYADTDCAGLAAEVDAPQAPK